MSGEAAGNLFENMADRLTLLFGSDSGPAEDNSNFHTRARICTASKAVRGKIEQSTDEQHVRLTADVTRIAVQRSADTHISGVARVVNRQ